MFVLFDGALALGEDEFGHVVGEGGSSVKLILGGEVVYRHSYFIISSSVLSEVICELDLLV